MKVSPVQSYNFQIKTVLIELSRMLGFRDYWGSNQKIPVDSKYQETYIERKALPSPPLLSSSLLSLL